MTISGWGTNSAPTPTTGAGAQVQRTGTTRTLGSPTAADFHPEDPNPGMLDPVVRANVIKMDGARRARMAASAIRAARSSCNQFGQDYFAGVGYFGGLSCEDYSLFVRNDPFLPFLDLSYKRGGQDMMKQHLPVRDAQRPGHADRPLRLPQRQRRGGHHPVRHQELRAA